VAVETRQGVAVDSAEAQAAAQTLAHEIKTYIGTSARIELRASGGVERSLGKAKRVLDQRKL
jgi:phenylacetate-CoA ligase